MKYFVPETVWNDEKKWKTRDSWKEKGFLYAYDDLSTWQSGYECFIGLYVIDMEATNGETSIRIQGTKVNDGVVFDLKNVKYFGDYFGFKKYLFKMLVHVLESVSVKGVNVKGHKRHR